MKIVQIAPGSGGDFYCENCLRDHELLDAMRTRGCETMLVPLYLPLLDDEPGTATATEVFFGGVNVYLQQKSALFRHTPRWVDRLFDSRGLLNWAAKKVGLTDPKLLGDTTLSMLRGEQGRQRKELARLVDFLVLQRRPDVVFLSNALLLGLAGEIRRKLGVPIVCFLQDEDAFLDSLPEPYRSEAWEILVERACDADLFIAPSRYYAGEMRRRLNLDEHRVRCVPFGLSVDDVSPARELPQPPVIGFLSPLCPAKGVHLLAEAFVRLKSLERFKPVRLKLAGGIPGSDKAYVREISDALAEKGLVGDVEFVGNLDRRSRREFLSFLTVLSVPATGPEAMGLFALEAWAAGVPVVLADHGGHGELVGSAGGGLLCKPNDPQSLADRLATLLDDEALTIRLGAEGRKAVENAYSAESWAGEITRLLDELLRDENIKQG